MISVSVKISAKRLISERLSAAGHFVVKVIVLLWRRIMLRVYEVNRKKNFRILNHGENVFHEALKYVLLGETYFHVQKDGDLLYDLFYIENQKFAETSPDYVDADLYRDMPLYPPYYFYDENDGEKADFDLLKDVEAVCFEKVSEYSVALSRAILDNTDVRVIFRDDRIRWFTADDRIEVSDSVCTGPCINVVDEFYPSAFLLDYTTMDAMTMFHNMFFIQWLTSLPLSKIKYIEFTIPAAEGIGSILIAYGIGKAYFEKKYGITVTIRRGSPRYSAKVLEKYFTLRFTPEDSDETNTIYIVNYYSVIYVKAMRRSPMLDESILNPDFLSEMQLYARAVFGEKRVLGLLLRGTDYITTGLSGSGTPAAMKDIIEKVKEWKNQYQFDKLFLATEDDDILDVMVQNFRGDILAISQERYRISDFTDELRTIGDLDCARHPDSEDYSNFTEDVLVNYFYALYLLSRCDAFIYSRNCCGMVLTRVFNRGRFERMLCISDGKEIVFKK